jgi:hypothetical protein
MVVSDGGECMVEGVNLGLFGGQLWCNNHPQNQQSQPNPTQTIEATRLVFIQFNILTPVKNRVSWARLDKSQHLLNEGVVVKFP